MPTHQELSKDYNRSKKPLVEGFAIKKVKLNGVSIFYDEQGDPEKETLVFVHGSACDYRTWERQLDFFATQYHVVAYSRRSHYPNPYMPYTDTYSVKTESEDLAALIQTLTHAPVHLIGWSYGALIAATTAKQHPTFVRSLVLAEPPIFSFLTAKPETLLLYRQYQAIVRAVRAALDAQNYGAAMETFIDGISGTGTFGHSHPEQQKGMLQNAKTLYELPSAERDPFNSDDVAKIAAPTLVVRGERTTGFLPEIAKELTSRLPHSECAVIKGASHPMHSQNPLDYNRAVLSFLKAQTNAQ